MASAASGDAWINVNVDGGGGGGGGGGFGGPSSQFPVILEGVEAMLQQMATELAGIAADSGDGTARVNQEVEKRYQQVRHPGRSPTSEVHAKDRPTPISQPHLPASCATNGMME
ncbi:hypothetical protein Vretimale_15803 [Volvox reticuliferus]|uniref:Uncharacterized protein n=1 Tax=Volvox reticuliferus TaxID=1737510 RepID=A0A8J4LW08_9CHLO|nr:hypothetical protein Vretimale_15803 [Volvox reticuliferus]